MNQFIVIVVVVMFAAAILKASTRPIPVAILLVALSLCASWTLLTWPGFTIHGQFFSYPVTPLLLCFWAVGWLAILGPTLLIVRRLWRR
jgi:hypothetical protein